VSLFPLLFESKDLIALNKPPGRLVIPGRDSNRSASSLREELEQLRGQKLYVVHRLDKDTTGVLLFALHAKAHRALSLAFEAGRICKTYEALVAGRVSARLDICAPLVPARRGRMRVARAGEAGKAAQTVIEPVQSFERATWVRAYPASGRTHQIRVHLESVGHPLLCDPQYGRPHPVTERELGGLQDDVILSRTPLHASVLEWPQLEGVLAPGRVEAPLWADMARALSLAAVPR
jgi:RluA family pseudouridine synthase